MNRQKKYHPELRERAIRMVYEQYEHHESQWAAIESVAQKISWGITLYQPTLSLAQFRREPHKATYSIT